MLELKQSEPTACMCLIRVAVFVYKLSLAVNCRTAVGGNEVRRVAYEKQAVAGKEGCWERFGNS